MIANLPRPATALICLPSRTWTYGYGLARPGSPPWFRMLGVKAIPGRSVAGARPACRLRIPEHLLTGCLGDARCPSALNTLPSLARLMDCSLATFA